MDRVTALKKSKAFLKDVQLIPLSISDFCGKAPHEDKEENRNLLKSLFIEITKWPK